MSTLTVAQRQLYIAVAELAFAIAQSDKEVSPLEIEAFRNALQVSLGEHHHLALQHFVGLQKKGFINTEKALDNALAVFQQHRGSLSRLLIRKFLYVLERVSEVMGISEAENDILIRFERTALRIYEGKTNNAPDNLDIQRTHLYSTIGQLAYVVAMADHVLQPEERDAFLGVIKEHLGVFDWLAEDRFDAIDDLMLMDVESTYDHALFLIKRNAAALTPEIIAKFKTVLTRVAEVSGIAPQEQAIITRFGEDIARIFAATHPS